MEGRAIITVIVILRAESELYISGVAHPDQLAPPATKQVRLFVVLVNNAC